MFNENGITIFFIKLDIFVDSMKIGGKIMIIEIVVIGKWNCGGCLNE